MYRNTYVKTNKRFQKFSKKKAKPIGFSLFARAATWVTVYLTHT